LVNFFHITGKWGISQSANEGLRQLNKNSNSWYYIPARINEIKRPDTAYNRGGSFDNFYRYQLDFTANKFQ
jgi:hypothetical protein